MRHRTEIADERKATIRTGISWSAHRLHPAPGPACSSTALLLLKTSHSSSALWQLHIGDLRWDQWSMILHEGELTQLPLLPSEWDAPASAWMRCRYASMHWAYLSTPYVFQHCPHSGTRFEPIAIGSNILELHMNLLVERFLFINTYIISEPLAIEQEPWALSHANALNKRSPMCIKHRSITHMMSWHYLNWYNAIMLLTLETLTLQKLFIH